MKIVCEKVHITRNEDDTYKMELFDCFYVNGKEINANIVFPKLISKFKVVVQQHEQEIPKLNTEPIGSDIVFK